MAHEGRGFRYEKNSASQVLALTGIDEAGRGAFAGRLLPLRRSFPKIRHRRLNDSKQLASESHEEIYRQLISNPE